MADPNQAGMPKVDGDRHQIEVFQAEAAARGISVKILVDFIHVLEYLWKAAWCFCPPRDPAAEDWVTAQGLDILHGRAAEVTGRIQALAAAHPPRPGSEHDKIIRTTLTYLDAKTPYLDYPGALAAGWPIATGVIEGACRHLIQDRMGITGARWGLPGAQAMLWLRALRANGDLTAYWNLPCPRSRTRQVWVSRCGQAARDRLPAGALPEPSWRLTGPARCSG